MLAASDLTVRLGDRLVLDRVACVVNPGDRIGLVGPNGAGKSTLLAALSGGIAPAGGSVWRDPAVTIGYLRQGFADLPGGTLADLLDIPTDGLLAAQHALESAASRLGDAEADPAAAMADYDRALGAFEARGGYTAVDGLDALLGRLGLDPATLDSRTPLTALSGGQKTRAGLAGLLASAPDVLLLDEPTNHLDLDALGWLEGFVAGYRGGAVVVSHDRAFLDRVVTGIFALDGVTRRLTVYPGSYSDFQAARRAEEEAQADAYARQQAEIARIERDIRDVASHALATERSTQHDYLRGRAKKVARTAKVRERKLERRRDSAEVVDRPERRWEMALDFGAVVESGRDVAVASGVSVALGGRTVLDGVALHIRAGERIALTGPNGGGKTTLVRLLVGDLVPDRGSVRLGVGVVVGWHAQEQETVNPDQTVLAQARRAAPISEDEARAFLHRFLFAGDDVLYRAADLSYGERSRLALALLVLRGANFLVLDEPLNHLDLAARARFEAALAAFTGTVLVVLHDRYAIARLATRTLELRDGRLREVGPMDRQRSNAAGVSVAPGSA